MMDFVEGKTLVVNFMEGIALYMNILNSLDNVEIMVFGEIFMVSLVGDMVDWDLEEVEEMETEWDRDVARNTVVIVFSEDTKEMNAKSLMLPGITMLV